MKLYSKPYDGDEATRDEIQAEIAEVCGDARGSK